MEDLTTPSQRRYVQYFGMLLDCIPPKKQPFLLRSVKLSGVPLKSARSSLLVDVFNCGTLVFSKRVVPAAAEGDETAPRTVEVVCGRPIRVGTLCDDHVGQHHPAVQRELRGRETLQRVSLHVPHGLYQQPERGLLQGPAGRRLQRPALSRLMASG